MFQDRTAAGERLGAQLTEQGVDADIVLGIPRGALPVARPVADALDAPLDIVVASKIGAPNNPELAIGAVGAAARSEDGGDTDGSDESYWLNDDLVDRLGVSEEYIEDEREDEAQNASQKAERYREDGQFPDLRGKRVVVVDDGVATGATAMACLRQVNAADATHCVLAVPVGSPDSLATLEAEADEVIALQTPQDFRAVGQYYQTFGQVSDEEAIAYLDNKSGETP